MKFAIQISPLIILLLLSRPYLNQGKPLRTLQAKKVETQNTGKILNYKVRFKSPRIIFFLQGTYAPYSPVLYKSTRVLPQKG